MDATLSNQAAGVGGVIAASSTSSANTVLIRGANNEVDGSKHRGTALEISGHTFLGYNVITTSVAIDGVTYDATFYKVDCTLGNVIVTLPTAVTSPGTTNQILIFKRVDATANTCTLDGFSTQTIEGSLTYLLTQQNDTVGIMSDSVNFNVLFKSRSASGTLYVQTAATAAISNTNSETDFDSNAQYTIPANSLKVGDIIRIQVQGIVTAHTSSDTLNVKAKIGSTVLGSTGAINNAANDTYSLDITIIVRTIGASGTFVVFGKVCDGTPGTATAKDLFLGSTAIDTTATQLLKLTGTWSNASASDSVRNDIFTVRREAV